MTVLAAFLVLASGQAIDGEGAVGVARQFLTRMGVPKSGTLTGLTDHKVADRSGTNHRIWSVGFNLGKGLSYSIDVDTRGRVVYLCSSEMKGGGVPHSPASIRRGQWLMSRVPNAVPVVQDPTDTFLFHAVVHGRQYFNINPSYGYRIHFDKNGQITWFGREDDLPPVILQAPRIDRAAAIKALTAAWQKTKPTPWPYPRRVDPELGYYLRKGEKTARLVWRGTVMSFNAGTWQEFSDMKTFVDAVNGAPIPADDRY